MAEPSMNEMDFCQQICDVCHCRTTSSEDLYEIDSNLICEECVVTYIERFKNPVRNYTKGE